MISSRIVLESLLNDFSPETFGEFAPLHPGVDILPLYGLMPNGKAVSEVEPAAALIRYAPGAEVPRHGHPGFEHIIVLSGSQSDESGSYPAGTCLINPPGSTHSVTSPTGCLVLAIWSRPVQILPATANLSEAQ